MNIHFNFNFVLKIPDRIVSLIDLIYNYLFANLVIFSPPFLQFQELVCGENWSVVLRNRRLWSFRFTVPTDRHCRTSPVVAYKDQNISACEERARNDVKYRRIRSLTFTSIYGIYFAWGFLMTSEKSKNVFVRKRASSARVLVKYDLQANLGPWIWFTSESRQ